MNQENVKTKSGLATAGLVLGIIAICTSFIPIVNNASFVLGVLAVIFAIICLVKKTSKGKVIAALVLGIVSIIITLALQSSWGKSIDKISDDLDKATGNKTEDVLKKDLDVTIGDFTVKTDDIGLQDTELIVTVKNKASKKMSFSVKIEAVDKSGNRIDTDTLYIDNLNAGQKQEEKIFTLVTSENIEKYKNAEFKILEASAY